jgi:hypothetical protein
VANGSEMETLSDATRRLQDAGYGVNWYADDTGLLVCQECQLELDPAEAVIHEVVRFEGPSDPGDEAILFAVQGPGDHRGLYSVTYGPYMPAGDSTVVRALNGTRSSHDT